MESQAMPGEIDYGQMMQRAMRGLMAEALGIFAEDGPPGTHHFYITFDTRHPGVDIPDWLRDRYPKEITIVLQHEFRDLAVMTDRFTVTLSFSERPATMVIPLDAVKTFVDPSVEFGLRFDPIGDEDEDVEGEETEVTTAPHELAVADVPAADPKPADNPAEVVSLDAFRKS